MLKKIPYAVLLLAAYLVMTWNSSMAVLSGTAADAVTAWDSVAKIANYIVALGPMVLFVLMIINTIKPLVGQVGGVVCLIMSVAYGYRVFTIINTANDYFANAEYVDAQVLYFIENILASAVFALQFWLVGAKIQDEEVVGKHTFVGSLGMVLTILLAFTGTESGVLPTTVIPYLLLMNTAKKFPAVFVPDVTPMGGKVKHIIILAILVGLYFFVPASLAY